MKIRQLATILVILAFGGLGCVPTTEEGKGESRKGQLQYETEESDAGVAKADVIAGKSSEPEAEATLERVRSELAKPIKLQVRAGRPITTLNISLARTPETKDTIPPTRTALVETKKTYLGNQIIEYEYDLTDVIVSPWDNLIYRDMTIIPPDATKSRFLKQMPASFTIKVSEHVRVATIKRHGGVTIDVYEKMDVVYVLNQEMLDEIESGLMTTDWLADGATAYRNRKGLIQDSLVYQLKTGTAAHSVAAQKEVGYWTGKSGAYAWISQGVKNVSVSGYRRANGVYVQGHMRSHPGTGASNGGRRK